MSWCRYTNMEEWILHWECQLYKALEFQVLEMLFQCSLYLRDEDSPQVKGAGADMVSGWFSSLASPNSTNSVSLD
mgnify:CR=1 FL=1